MPETLESTRLSVEPSTTEPLTETLRRVEQRLEALEAWRLTVEGRAGEAIVAPTIVEEEAVADLSTDEASPSFDLALTGRTLIILGGAFLLRAATEGGAIPAAAGVGIGLLYAVSWSFFAMRAGVSRNQAFYYALATVFTSLPLIFEGARRFKVFDAWSSALALTAVGAVMFVLIARRRLHGTAWLFTVMAIGIIPPLIVQTSGIVPFTLVVIALGIVTLWLGHFYGWQLLPWSTAIALDVLLLAFSFLLLTDRLPQVSPQVAIAVYCVAFAAWLASFAIRALAGRREVADVEIVQTFALLFLASGGAMWIAASRTTWELPLAIAMIGLGAVSYAVSFTFVARRFATPRNFVFVSSLALMLVVLGGAFIARGLANSVLWSALALAGAWFGTHFRKSSLVLHTAVFLFCGFIGADVFSLGLRTLLLEPRAHWPIPGEGALLLLAASLLAAGIRPIERQGSFALWTVGKAMILAELGWLGATLSVSAAGLLFLDSVPIDPAMVAVLRTAVLALLTVGTAWASRYATLSPGRLLCNPMMVILAAKLVFDDVRAGRPSTLFLSFALVGIALILTPRLRRNSTTPHAAIAADQAV